MAFITPDDHIILMDIPKVTGQRVSQDEMCQLRDAGILTTFRFYTEWDEVNPAPGVWDFSGLDAYVAQANAVGMKTLLACYSHGPSWAPTDWLVQTATGPQPRVLSPWNEAAQAASLELYTKMRDHFTSPTVEVIDTWLVDGETMFLNEPAWYDPEALASYKLVMGSSAVPAVLNPDTDKWLHDSYIGMYMNQQTILQAAHNEVWTALHPALAGMYQNGNIWIPDLLANYATFPGVQICQFYYTWIQWQYLWPAMLAWKAQFNTHVFGGAEYSTGLPTTAPAAKAFGGGLLCGVLHPFTGIPVLQPGMVQLIREAIKVMS
jgi:Beta-galactosidase